jgi:hypothetical protein
MELITFKITSNPSLLDEQNHITPYVATLLSKIYLELPKAKDSTLKNLLKYAAQFPKVPIFKNYLTSYYTFKNNYEKARECNLWLIKEHPNYLFGLLNYASTLIENENFNEAKEVLGNNLLLNELYPNRTEFHLDEVMSYFSVTIHYLLATDNLEEAEIRLEILKEIDNEHPKYLMAEKMKINYFFQAATKRMGEESELMMMVPEIDRKSALQTTKPPVFHYTKEINILYTTSINSIKDTQLELFNHLGRNKLTEDLIEILKDSIVRFDYYIQLLNDGENFDVDFVSHAFLLLAHLKQEKTIPFLLDILRQDEEYVEFWFGDSLASLAIPAIYFSEKNNYKELISFIKEPNIGAYTKSMVSESLCKILYFKKEVSKTVLIGYCKDILDFFIENKEDENIIDTEFLGLFVSDLVDYKLKELLPEIEQLFDLGIVGYWVCGDYESVVNDINTELNEDLSLKENSISEKYIDFRKSWNYSDAFLDDSNIDDNLLQQTPINPSYFVNETKKIGRNEPCFCESGKKYKKCCTNL